MAAIDSEAINRFAVPGLILMENAGLQVVRYLEECWTGKGKVVIFCGKGNNGGDGFVIARHLAQRGYRPHVWAMDRRSGYRGDAAINYEILLQQGFPVKLPAETDPGTILNDLGEDDLIIDALLGTGLNKDVSPPFAALIAAINGSPAPVLAVDIPSGVCADSGEIRGVAVNARHTVTFALPKRGLLLFPGAACAGRVVVADIGMPRQLCTDPAIKENLITGQAVQTLLPARPAQSHKGTFGRLFILAGSPGMSGAAVLAAEAALRGGAGLVYLGAAPELRPLLEAKLKEVIVRELPGDGAGNLDITAFPRIREEARLCSALAVGPGMDPGPATLALLQQIMAELPFPLVLDAGALAALARKPSLLKGPKPPLVLTPHPGEMGNLLELGTQEVQRRRWELAVEKAQEWGCVLVLKGAHTAIGLPTGELFVNTTGNAALATAGSGDLLTGLITAMLAQGLATQDAAMAGVWLHGLAADLLVGARGMRGHTAADLLPFFADAFRQLESLPVSRPGELVFINT